MYKAMRAALPVGMLLIGIVVGIFLASPGDGNAQPGESKFNVVVLCDACALGGHVERRVILDQNTGVMWAYESLYEKPIRLGRWKTMGEGLSK